MTTTVDIDELVASVQDLGVLALDFGRVQRVTFHQDGVTPETDTTHTVMLVLLACALAERIGGLDVGAVAQLAAVHDVPEVYALDTSTLRLPTAEEHAAKVARERVASARITRRFIETLSWLPLNLYMYEHQTEREARFVWGVDKICPKITHIANGCVTPRAQGVGADELADRYDHQRVQMLDRCGEWPVLIDVYDRLVEEELRVLRSAPPAPGEVTR